MNVLVVGPPGTWPGTLVSGIAPALHAITETFYDAILLAEPSRTAVRTLRRASPASAIVVMSSEVERYLAVGADDATLHDVEGTLRRAALRRAALLRQENHSSDDLTARVLDDLNHELRTPMTTLRLLVPLLRRGPTPNQLDRVANNIQRLVQALEAVLDDVNHDVMPAPIGVELAMKEAVRDGARVNIGQVEPARIVVQQRTFTTALGWVYHMACLEHDHPEVWAQARGDGTVAIHVPYIADQWQETHPVLHAIVTRDLRHSLATIDQDGEELIVRAHMHPEDRVMAMKQIGTT